jgi:hypothetical protein
MEQQIEHFDVNLSGVTKRNADGSDRQILIRGCVPGEQLLIEPEPDNPYDENAIRVCRRNGAQVGYIPANTARIMTERARARDTAVVDRYKVFVHNIHGGSGDKPSVGITVRVVAPDPHSDKEVVTDNEARDYVFGSDSVERPTGRIFLIVFSWLMVLLALSIIVYKLFFSG